MSAHAIRILPVVFALATAARAASYPIRHLDPTDALMALNVRVADLGQVCATSPIQAKDPGSAGVRGFLEVKCNTAEIQARVEAALAAIDSPRPTQRFHVAVLTAWREEGRMPELSAGEQKALNDFKKVMTYRSFQTEAEAILQCDRDTQARLNGNGNYAVELSINRSAGGGESIEVRKFQLVGIAVQTENLIETSFSIKKGETIVLGASMSDRAARVVLVTALP